jgi:hypothetical protein
MDQFWLLIELLVELLNLPIVVTMFTVLTFMTNLNGFPMLTFTSGTKDVFRLILYDATYFMACCSRHFSETYSSFHTP